LKKNEGNKDNRRPVKSKLELAIAKTGGSISIQMLKVQQVFNIFNDSECNKEQVQ